MWTAENKNDSSRKEAKKRPRTQKKERKVIGKFFLAMIGLLFTMSGTIFAETAATNITVTANIQGTCKFSSDPKNMDFGSYDPTSTVDNMVGHTLFRYKCTRGTTYRLYITRANQMLRGTNSINYELYVNAGRTTVFPATAAGAPPKTTSNNGQVSVNIYGKIPNSQDVLSGIYTETDVITIEY